MTISKAASRRAHALCARLAERFPATFVDIEQEIDPRPLAVGIMHDIEAAMPEVDRRDLHHALGVYCARLRYRRASIVGAERIGLDGQVAGQVTAEDVERVKAKWATIKQVWAERKRRKAANAEAEVRKSSAADAFQLPRASHNSVKPLGTVVVERIAPLAPISVENLDRTAAKVAGDWGVTRSLPSPRDRRTQKPFAVEVKRRRIVLSAKDRFEHGR